MLLEKIESLRKESKDVRNRYAFGIALSVTLLIAIVWAISLPARMSIPTTVVSENEEDVSSEIRNIKEFVEGSVENIKNQAELLEAVAKKATSTEQGTTTFDN